MFELNHIIAASAVDAEERRLEEALARAGYDVAKLTLTSLAQQAVAEKAKAIITGLNITINSAMHEGLADGSVQVRFVFETDGAHSLATMYLA